MMSTRQVFGRVVVYALVLSAIDAVSGRLLRASPEPSLALSLGATAWIAYRLAQGGQARVAFGAAITLWALYMLGFVVWARLLVGWNGAVPWTPRSTTWMLGLAAAAPVIAIAAQFVGARAASRGGPKAAASG
jgi:hypothetical protein